MNIGVNIKNRRNQLGITLLELAEAIGVREATVQRYESGSIKNIKHETIINIANALKTTPAYLMGWSDDTKNQPQELPLTADEKKLIAYFKLCDDEDKKGLLWYAEQNSKKNTVAATDSESA